MRAPSFGPRWCLAVAGAFAFSASPEVVTIARADADASAAPIPPMTSTARCERVAGPGRVRCDVEVRTSAPGSIRWADVQIIEIPTFITALKGRVGPLDASVREPELVRFALGLVARDRGAGDVHMRVRAIVCTGETCGPVERREIVRVVVGPPG